MLESKKDLLLKSVCCLMLLQINGEAKGSTQMSLTQKEYTREEKGLSRKFDQSLPKMAFPIKSESNIMLPSSGTGEEKNTRFPDAQKIKKDQRVVVRSPFVQRKMNMRSTGKNRSSQNGFRSFGTVQKPKSTSFQWTRIATQRGGKIGLNRSVANRLCNEHC